MLFLCILWLALKPWTMIVSTDGDSCHMVLVNGYVYKYLPDTLVVKLLNARLLGTNKMLVSLLDIYPF